MKSNCNAPSGNQRRLIVLAVDGMDQKFLDELGEAGLVPHISTLFDAGSWGRAIFPLPRYAESGWTSVATGMLPDRHGILHANERVGDSVFVRAVTSSSLKAPGLWHYAAASGMKPAVIGWPATSGLKVDGCLIIAPGIALSGGRIEQAWPLHPDAIWPHEMRTAVREHRVHPGEIGAEDIDAMLGPLSGSARQQLQPEFVAAFAELVTLHSLGTYAITELNRDALILRLPFLSVINKLLSQVSSDPGARSCLVRCYQFLDLLIGRYQNLAGSDATYAVISNGNSGLVTKSGSARQDDEGFLVLAGPLIRKDTVISALAATDIVPTLTTLLDWQLEVELDGEPLLEAVNFDPGRSALARTHRHIDLIESEHIKRTATITLENKELLEREGVPIPDYTAQTQFAQQLECETLLALAEARLCRGESRSALSLLKELLQRFPKSIPARAMLAEMLFTSGQIEECERIVQEFALVQAGGMWADLAYGVIAYARENWMEATTRFERLILAAQSPINAHAWLGRIFAYQAKWPQSHQHFKAATEHEPRNARAWEGLGIACSMLNHHSEATNALGRAVSLMPRSVRLLLLLCKAWEECGELEHAAQFRARAIKIDPNAVAASSLRSAVEQPVRA